MDLNSMTLEELKKLQKEVNKAITSFEARRLSEAREKLEAHAREMGFTLSDFAGTAKKAKGAGRPKYRHPEDPETTWTGRGRKPAWIVEAQSRGEDIADFEIS